MFKAGDKVRIKLNSQTNRPYNGDYFISQIKDYIGEIGTITHVLYDGRRYELDICKKYHFSNDMLEPINDSDSAPSYKVGDIIRIIDEMPKDLHGIDIHTWLRLLGKSGKIEYANSKSNSYLVFIPEISVSFYFPSNCFKKEATSTSENSIEKISKLIECVPEIELSYCKKQIYTV